MGGVGSGRKPGHIPHGTRTKYQYGCRCDDCRRVESARGREYRSRPDVRQRARERWASVGRPRPRRAFRARRRSRPVRERLLSRLIIDPSGCLLWTGALDRDGYGRIKVNGKDQMVHRVMWEMFEGLIPDDLPQVDHVKNQGCHYRHCASIAHLEPVTPRENVQRSRVVKRNRAR